MIALLQRLRAFLQQLMERREDALDVFPEDEPIPYLPAEVA